MEHAENHHRLPVLETGADGFSRWVTMDWPVEDRGGMLLSPRLDCSSLRMRYSKPGYAASWHVASEPVLIVVRSGALRIGLRDGGTRDFFAGDAFIAADRVPDGQAFDPDRHGHTAKVISEETLQAIHIKLASPVG